MPPVSSLKVSPLPPRAEVNPFEIFFQDPVYLEFKNHLYNYLRRRAEIRRFLKEPQGILLEVGSGVSPIAEAGRNVIYSDAVPQAMTYMRNTGLAEKVLVMSATQMAIENESVSTIVCSEVLEHITEDARALEEMMRVLKPGGTLILTVPVHSHYFSYDDSFVRHERRYDIKPFIKFLGKKGFGDFQIFKVAALLEKITMILAVFIFKVIKRFSNPAAKTSVNHPILKVFLPFYKLLNAAYSHVVGWEAHIMPLALSSIVLIHCRKPVKAGC